MVDFANLTSLCLQLESHAHEYLFARDIADLFSKIATAKDRTGDSRDIEKAQWETDFFDVHFDAGDPKSVDFDSWQTGKHDYLVSRLELSRSPVLKARYSHILYLFRGSVKGILIASESIHCYASFALNLAAAFRGYVAVFA